MPQAESSSAASRRIDLAVAGVLCLIAMIIASWYVPHFSASGGKPRFYQEEFGAAVMEACGFGFVNPDGLTSPALKAFLSRSTDEVSCGELSPPPPAPLRPMQRAFRYLMSTVAETWRVRGRVAWSALTPLFAALYGVTIVLAYFIFRQGMGPLLAGILGFLIAISTLQLNNLPHLRDFSKAPFVLALVLIAMRLVSVTFGARRTLVLAAAAGVITGIGMGFRNDVLVAIPAFIGLFAFFLPVGWRERLGVRAAAIAIYLLAVAASMFPMLSVYNTGGGGSTPHLVLLGLTPGFSRDLGVDNSRLYEWGFEYRDELALAMIDNYSDRRLGRHEFLKMYGADYDRAATQYLREIAGDFPADLLARVYASAVRITELPYSQTTSALMPPPLVDGAMRTVFEARAWMARRIGLVWPAAFVFTLIALGFHSLHLGVFAALFIFYVAAYPSLQFQERHFFHLEFVAWWALGFTLSVAFTPFVQLARGRRNLAEGWMPLAQWRRPFVRAVALVAVMVIAVSAPLWLARRYQRVHAAELIAAIDALPRTDVTLIETPSPNGSLFEMPSIPSALPQDDGVHAAYVAADLGGEACDALEADVTFRYRALNPNYDFSHSTTVRIPRENAPLRLYFPAFYRSPDSSDPFKEPFAFRGLELAAPAAPCLMRVSRVDRPENLPALMDMRLPPDWKNATPYATISGVEGRENPAATYAFPADMSRRRFQRVLAKPVTPFNAGDIKNASPTFTMDGERWSVSGAGGVGGLGPLLYLVEMKDRRLSQHTSFVAEGRIDRGGVTFGLVRGVTWIVQLHVRQTGPFSVVIDVPEDGDYRVIMANNLIDMSFDNEVTVSRAGLVAPDGAPAP